MLTIKEYKRLLKIADRLLVKALRDDDARRQCELLQYKAILKDDLIRLLEHELTRIHIAKVA